MAVAQPRILGAVHRRNGQATHGSFDIDMRVVAATIERINGSRAVKPIEWLDH